MTEGVMTYDGLAAPLFGEYEQKQQTVATDMITLTGGTSQTGDFLVCQDVDGTERVWINADGCIYTRGASVTDDAYVGLDARGVVDAASDGEWHATIGGRLTTAQVHDGGTQEYALYGAVYHTGTNSGGRTHVLGLYFSITNATAGNGACSFIYFVEAGTIPYFFTIGGMTNDAAGGCFHTVTHSFPDHGLKIDIDGTSYYIMLCDASAT